MKTVPLYKLLGGAAILAAAYLLKDFYSRAGSAELAWIIGPTALLADLFSGLSFSHEPGYGWVDVQHQAVIAPVCAGVNFLIIAFCMSSFQILHRTTSPHSMIAGFLIGGTASYLLTVIANAIRIVLAVTLYAVDVYPGWLTAEMAHRIVGIVVYYLFLCAYCLAVSCVVQRANHDLQEIKTRSTKPLIYLVPLFWYLLFSLGIPLAHNSLHNDPELFFRHALTVGLVTALLTLILYKFQRWYAFVIKDLYISQ